MCRSWKTTSFWIIAASVVMAGCSQNNGNGDGNLAEPADIPLSILDDETTLRLAAANILDTQLYADTGAQVDYSLDELYLSMGRTIASSEFDTLVNFPATASTRPNDKPIKLVDPIIFHNLDTRSFGCEDGQINLDFSTQEAVLSGNGSLTLEFLNCRRTRTGYSEVLNGTISWEAQISDTVNKGTVVIGNGNDKTNNKDLVKQQYDPDGTLIRTTVSAMTINFSSTQSDALVTAQFMGNGKIVESDHIATVQKTTVFDQLRYVNRYDPDDPYILANRDITLDGAMQTEAVSLNTPKAKPDWILYQGFSDFHYTLQVDNSNPTVSYETIDGKLVRQNTPADTCDDGVYFISTLVPLKRANRMLTDQGSLRINDSLSLEVTEGTSGLIQLSQSGQEALVLSENSRPDICLLE